MNNFKKGIRLKEITFISENNDASIEFNGPIYVINGASNTGKSFLIDSIDYMLGMESIDKIDEAADYEEIKIKIELNEKPFTLYRKFSDSKFEIYSGFLDRKEIWSFKGYYKVGKATQKVKNINDFFLSELGISEREISINLWAEKNKLTIRLLSRVIFSKEERIISTDSPIEEGDRSEKSTNRNVFKSLLTGVDDSDAHTVTRQNDFKFERKGRLHALEEVIKELESSLEFPEEDLNSLNARKEKLSEEEKLILNTLTEAQKGLAEVVKEREGVSNELNRLNERSNNLSINANNFQKLREIYKADIERLKSQEEAAFLLTVGHDGECSVCGSQSDLICKDLNRIKLLAKASFAEISKIEEKSSELQSVLDSVYRQKVDIQLIIDNLKLKIRNLDNVLIERTPLIKENDKKLIYLREIQKLVTNDIFIRSRINELNKKVQESELVTAPKKYISSDFYPSESVINGFCKVYSGILDEINFPGDHTVEFDYKRFDVIIGGKARHLNGKGVRAILNSVFKISILQYCRENDLFHPGLVILDSPLVTYRDPLTSKHGELKEDEKELARSKISYRFLKYLSSISELAQFIIIENIDIPDGLGSSISVESFHGEGAPIEARYGLF